MTATATKSEEASISQLCDMNNPVIVRSNPVTSNHMFYKVKRPPSINGFRGKGDGKPSTLDLIKLLLLDKFIESVKRKEEPKIAMIFVQSFSDLNAINGHLLVQLQGHVDGKHKPWIVNYSGVGKLTKVENQKRMKNGEIKFYITTSVMLCGVDLPR